MQIDWWTLGLQAINSLVLIWLLTRYLFSPVAKIVSERQQAATSILDDAKHIREQAESDLANAQQQLADQAKHHDALLQAASDEASTLKESILENARQDASAILADSRDELIRREHQSTDDIKTRASELSLEMANKLMDRLPEGARVEGFIDGLTKALALLPEVERKQLGIDGHPLKLISARALSEPQQNSVRQALTVELGREVPLELSVDPSLIAGLELESAHSAVRNSLVADLARIRSTLINKEY